MVLGVVLEDGVGGWCWRMVWMVVLEDGVGWWCWRVVLDGVGWWCWRGCVESRWLVIELLPQWDDALKHRRHLKFLMGLFRCCVCFF